MGVKILAVAGLLLALALPPAAVAKPPLVEPDEGPDPQGLTLQDDPARRGGARLLAQRDALRNARARVSDSERFVDLER